MINFIVKGKTADKIMKALRMSLGVRIFGER
jgi:hypothetical protein